MVFHCESVHAGTGGRIRKYVALGVPCGVTECRSSGRSPF